MIEKTTTEFDKKFNKIKEITDYGAELTYAYSFDDKNRITSVLMCNEENISLVAPYYFNYDGRTKEIKYFYDEYGNNIRIDEINYRSIGGGVNDEYTENIFNQGRIIKSNRYFAGNLDDSIYFEYDNKGNLYKKITDWGDETYFNPDGTIEKKLQMGGTATFGSPYESYAFNFIAFEYDNNGNEIAGKSGDIEYDFQWDEESQDHIRVFDYNKIEIEVTWEILYTFDKFGNWTTKLYIVNDKPSTLIEREIKYYDKGKSFEIS